jgi:hypothetical protein
MMARPWLDAWQFAAANTTRCSGQAPALSRRRTPESWRKRHPPGKQEGAGNAGQWPCPWPACRKKAGGSYHRFSRSSGIPCATVLTVSFVLSPGTGLVCPCRPQASNARELGLSVGRPGPHDFVVRDARVRRMQAITSIASRLTIVTTRSPLLPRRDAHTILLIYGISKVEYFSAGGWTGFLPGDPTGKSVDICNAPTASRANDGADGLTHRGVPESRQNGAEHL